MGQVSASIHLFIVLFLLFNGSIAYGDCAKPVQPIKQGEQASCTGYLVSPDQEDKAYKATRIAELQEKENKILEERLALYVKQSDSLAKELGRKKSTEDLIRVLYFAGGALITGYIASNIHK